MTIPPLTKATTTAAIVASAIAVVAFVTSVARVRQPPGPSTVAGSRAGDTLRPLGSYSFEATSKSEALPRPGKDTASSVLEVTEQGRVDIKRGRALYTARGTRTTGGLAAPDFIAGPCEMP